MGEEAPPEGGGPGRRLIRAYPHCVPACPVSKGCNLEAPRRGFYRR